MNNELQNKVLEWIQVTSEKIGDFASKEIPPFIHEYLQWKFWEAGISVGIWMFFFVIFIGIHIFVVKKYKEYITDSYHFASVLYVFFAIIPLVVFSISFFFEIVPSAKDMIQIKIAPKVYLVEKAADLIKK